MKNFTLVLLSAVVLGSLSSAVAQTFTLSNITPVSVSSDPWTPVESHVAISNTSNSLKRVRIERIINYSLNER